ncbi:hypothetical protein MRX96_021033 [Rhipicephalus microplus]
MNVGAKFDSYVEFDRAFGDFQVATNTLFVTKASKTVDVVNSRLSAVLTKHDSKFKIREHNLCLQARKCREKDGAWNSSPRKEEVTLSNHEKDEVQAPENSTFQGVDSGDTLHIDGAQKLLNQSQPSVTTEPLMSGSNTGGSANEKCSAGPAISGSETRSSVNQEGTASSPVSEIKLPLVKSRGRPSKRVLQSKLKRPREEDDGRPVPFRQLSEKSETQCAGNLERRSSERAPPSAGRCRRGAAELRLQVALRGAPAPGRSSVDMVTGRRDDFVAVFSASVGPPGLRGTPQSLGFPGISREHQELLLPPQYVAFITPENEQLLEAIQESALAFAAEQDENKVENLEDITSRLTRLHQNKFWSQTVCEGCVIFAHVRPTDHAPDLLSSVCVSSYLCVRMFWKRALLTSNDNLKIPEKIPGFSKLLLNILLVQKKCLPVSLCSARTVFIPKVDEGKLVFSIPSHYCGYNSPSPLPQDFGKPSSGDGPFWAVANVHSFRLMAVERMFTRSARFYTKGVRRDDPLSPILFNLVINQFLAKHCKEQIAFVSATDLDDLNVPGTAFAEDLVLFASTQAGLQYKLHSLSFS